MTFYRSKFGKIMGRLAHDAGNATCTIGASTSLIKSHLEQDTIDKDYILERVERIKDRNKRIDEVTDYGYKVFKELYEKPDGAMSILLERERQQLEENWTPEHDDTHSEGELLKAAHGYLHAGFGNNRIPSDWPWSVDWWKPSDNKIRNLEKAGALIAAEIDRLKRLENENKTTKEN